MAKSAVASQRNAAICPDAVERFRRFTMAHPRLLQARDELLTAIEASPPGSLILVLGPTGVGKTTLRRKVEETLIESMRPCLQADPGRIAVLTIEAVAPESGNFNWRDHFHRMLVAIREPLIDCKTDVSRDGALRAVNGRYTGCPRDVTAYQLQQSLENAVRHRRPAAVIVDEAQHLARIASGRKLSDQLDVVKSVGSRTQTVQVLIGTYELLAFRNLSGQLSRRSVDVHFPRYRAEDERDIDIFQNVVFTFQSHVPGAEAVDLAGIWDFLYERSVGCVGILRDWLMRAVITSLKNDRHRLTRRTIEQTALSVSQCEKIVAEAREGEMRLAETEQGRNRLRRLLNLEGPLSANHTEQPGEPAAPPSPAKTRTPGLRSPRRDPVGRTQVAYA
jgi:energy-coupling factor transporter ATP-binding protein EcfA2